LPLSGVVILSSLWWLVGRKVNTFGVNAKVFMC